MSVCCGCSLSDQIDCQLGACALHVSEDSHLLVAASNTEAQKQCANDTLNDSNLEHAHPSVMSLSLVKFEALYKGL